ncbi:SdpI family protein [Bifidobacterium sp. ESL0790]|uniref:SdpI family protein n=1 Tax=Bifidobacterium sp. ESL0790 TaxID=2983233 RepID=UPI0023F7F529|nr:SdpI family protein [Bifidobacterium sp. ESL0790]WEV71679.1 SdpI family protein [Bifidobacterium sp. ESL0790]
MRTLNNNQAEVQKPSDDESIMIEQQTSWKAVIFGAKNWNLAMVLLAFLPLIVYLLALPYMPSTIPMHYNGKNELDHWGSKYEGLFIALMALLFCAIWLLCEIPLERSVRKQSNSDMSPRTTVRMWIMGGCCVCLMSNIMNIWIIADAFSKGNMGSDIPLGPIMNVVTGLALIIFGNVMPGIKPNGWSGMRMPGAFKSRESWRRCQRFGGFEFIVGGIVLIAVGLVAHSSRFVGRYAILVVGLAIVAAFAVYSVYAGKKYGGIGGPLNRK